LFVPILDPLVLRNNLLESCSKFNLKGTVILAEEGINLFLAGTSGEVALFLCELKSDIRFSPLQAKESWSTYQPFKRMLVKVKKEIIRMNHPTIKPSLERAPSVDSLTVARWLTQGKDDNGREVVTLDTRNFFEVDKGSFVGSIDWRLKKFSDFPNAFEQRKSELLNKTVVSFCTGGIRCEKAAVLMKQAGLSDVYQLEGGILKYLEETGGQHYNGECFVFDERLSLTYDLSPISRISE